MIVNSKITVDLTSTNAGETINAMQGDCHTRSVEVTLLAGGQPWQPPEGVEAAVAYRTPFYKGLYDQLADGSPAISIEDNVATIILVPQMLDMFGVVDVALVFSDAALNQLTTVPFTIHVLRNPAVDAVATEDYIRLTWLQEKLDAYVAQLADGKDGASAYEIAVEHGFVGSVEDWLESLHGNPEATQAAKAAAERANASAQSAAQTAETVNGIWEELADLRNTTQTPVPAGMVWTSTANGAEWKTPQGGSGGASSEEMEGIRQDIINLAEECETTLNGYVAQGNQTLQQVETLANGFTTEVGSAISNAKDELNASKNAAKTELTDHTNGCIAELNRQISDYEIATVTMVKKAAPGNWLDNSNFTNLVAQASIGRNHGTVPYAADRWILDSGEVSYEAGVGLTLNGTIRQKLEFPPAGDVSAFVGMASGTAQISYSSGEVTITSSGGVIRWAALYAGSYTDDTMPSYAPKGYAAELAECQRYFIRRRCIREYISIIANNEFCFDARCNMREIPSVLLVTAPSWVRADGSHLSLSGHKASVYFSDQGVVCVKITVSGTPFSNYLNRIGYQAGTSIDLIADL